MKNFTELIAKLKIILDHYLDSVNNSFKVMFCIEKMNIHSPKDISMLLNIAKSNLTILVSKLRIQRYITQIKVNKKEISYSLTELGREKLNNKINSIKIAEEDKEFILKNLQNVLN
ncbi:MAG: winged helix-turn-helix transcriptional regulator [Clostridia bacterium]|nr:winged helix-turn-helix transcriptional regulator [Clostridia bacterium]